MPGGGRLAGAPFAGVKRPAAAMGGVASGGAVAAAGGGGGLGFKQGSGLGLRKPAGKVSAAFAESSSDEEGA
jgi:hypothetical protein